MANNYTSLNQVKVPREKKLQTVETDCFSLVLVRVTDICDHKRVLPERVSSDLAAVIHSIILYLMVAFTQIMVTLMLLMKTEEMEAEVENHWFQKHFHNITMKGAATIISHAVQVNNQSALPHDFFVQDGVLDRCKVQLQVQYYQFYYLMIFIWFSQMLIEARSIYCLLKALVMVQLPPSNVESLVLRDKPDGPISQIVYLPSGIRVLLIVALPVLRMCICIGVTYAGAKFLILQVDEVKILLKVLCMAFVVHIDEIFLKAFVGMRTARELSKVDVAYLEWSMGFSEKWETQGWSGFVYQAVPFLGLVFLEIIFSGLLSFRRACYAYHTHFGLEGVAPVHQTFAGFVSELLD